MFFVCQLFYCQCTNDKNTPKLFEIIPMMLFRTFWLFDLKPFFFFMLKFLHVHFSQCEITITVVNWCSLSINLIVHRWLTGIDVCWDVFSTIHSLMRGTSGKSLKSWCDCRRTHRSGSSGHLMISSRVTGCHFKCVSLFWNAPSNLKCTASFSH